ncbi:hypothetical protein OH77DRAFT_327482 [Trametes cingulata]|nr:hypothetical protein OH77DRAFT_327482 [Trametes cingulata]
MLNVTSVMMPSSVHVIPQRVRRTVVIMSQIRYRILGLHSCGHWQPWMYRRRPLDPYGSRLILQWRRRPPVRVCRSENCMRIGRKASQCDGRQWCPIIVLAAAGHPVATPQRMKNDYISFPEKPRQCIASLSSRAVVGPYTTLLSVLMGIPGSLGRWRRLRWRTNVREL